MKYIASVLALAALLGSEQQTSAIRLKAGFTDDLIKSLTEDMAKDAEQPEEPAPAQAAAQTETKAKETKKADSKKKEAKASGKKEKKAEKKKEQPKKKDEKQAAKKEPKKEEEDIPMDAAAIKAYSSVIADAAEDSEPKVPVAYTMTVPEEKPVKHDEFNPDPMGSMIQNEISSIKDASIKAAKEKDD